MIRRGMSYGHTGEHYEQFYFKVPWGADKVMTRFGGKPAHVLDSGSFSLIGAKNTCW